MTINELREQRKYSLDVWLSGASPEIGTRWEGDDGRRLHLDEFAFWPQAVKDAEAAYFAQLDAEYETAKAML